MKLKTYRKTDERTGVADGMPVVSIGKSGDVLFSKEFCDELKVTRGMHVLFHQDEASPEDWYVEITTHPDGYPLRAFSNSSSLGFRSKRLTSAILMALKIKGTRARFRVATVPAEDGSSLYAIFTRSHKEL